MILAALCPNLWPLIHGEDHQKADGVENGELIFEMICSYFFCALLTRFLVKEGRKEGRMEGRKEARKQGNKEGINLTLHKP